MSQAVPTEDPFEAERVLRNEPPGHEPTDPTRQLTWMPRGGQR